MALPAFTTMMRNAPLPLLNDAVKRLPSRLAAGNDRLLDGTVGGTAKAKHTENNKINDRIELLFINCFLRLYFGQRWPQSTAIRIRIGMNWGKCGVNWGIATFYFYAAFSNDQYSIVYL
jgi:hypothetical protein